MSSAVIELRGVHKQYGPVTALADASLSIGEGELVAIIGPSGAGKSTLLKIVAGEEAPTRGDVYIGGRRSTHLSPAARGVAVVYQDYSLFPHLTVRENVAFPIEARAARNPLAAFTAGAAASTQQVMGLLEAVNLAAHAQKRPDQLSGGEQQRAAIARAIAMNPKLICFDEPFSALDSVLRARLRQNVLDLKSASQGAFLYVTHNVEEAFALGDRVAVMINGRIAQLTTPRELYWKPANALIAELTGDVSMLSVASVEPSGDWQLCKTQGGAQVNTPAHQLVRPGDLLGFRPETVRIDAENPRARGRVARVTFEGAWTRVIVEAGGDVLAASTPSYALEAPNVGDEIGLNWRDEDCFVISKSDAKDELSWGVGR